MLCDNYVTQYLAQAAQQLWQVVRQAGLAAHLQALRGYYLLGHGDFYHAFLARVRHQLLQAPALLCSPARQRLCPACPTHTWAPWWPHASAAQVFILQTGARPPGRSDERRTSMAGLLLEQALVCA